MGLALDETDRRHVEYFLARLIKLRDIGPERQDRGICWHCADAPQHWLDHGFKLWPKFSGDSAYPVPSPRELDSSAFGAYNSCRNMWVGEYGALRLELVQFLIERAKQQLGQQY